MPFDAASLPPLSALFSLAIDSVKYKNTHDCRVTGIAPTGLRDLFAEELRRSGLPPDVDAWLSARDTSVCWVPTGCARISLDLDRPMEYIVHPGMSELHLWPAADD
jgi:hypothetical protein